MKRTRRQYQGDRALREAFKTITLQRADFACAVSDETCSGPLQAHHVVSQQQIRKVAKSEGWDNQLLGARLWDAGNGLAVCGRHHDRHTRAVERLPFEVIPTAALVFARMHNLMWWLERYYPEAQDQEAAA